jgi:hypothetical protein
MGDLGQPGSELNDLAPGDVGFAEEIARQKAAIPEEQLQQEARELVKGLTDHWARGVHAAIALGELLEEKLRRFPPDDHEGVWDRLATWLRRHAARHPLTDYSPNARDCATLVNEIAHCGDAGLGRPRFLDITK